MMRAMAIREFGPPDRIQSAELPRPRPAARQILIRVVAAGVNRLDCQLRGGRLEAVEPPRLPWIPGCDVAGVVDELGENASHFRKGDRVWALAYDAPRCGGTYAEYVAVPEEAAGLMPAKLLFEEAAAVPLSALAALQALGGRRPLQSGQTCLIHGAGGGVGHLAVQLARQRGAEVFATAHSSHQAFVLGLGATSVFPYDRDEFVAALGRQLPDGVDRVIDTVGGEVLARSYGCLKPGARLVSTVEAPDPAKLPDGALEDARLTTRPDADQLTELSRAVDAKLVRPHVERILRLDEAAEAHRLLEAGHVRGKLVLNL